MGSGIYNSEVLDTDTLDAIESVSAQIRSLFLVEHNEDGTHRPGTEATNFVPSGVVVPYAGSTAPNAWLLCNGAQVNRVAYKRLFAVVGTTFGAGDGSTTFHLPDMRQRFPLGKADSGTGSTLGGVGGTIDHSHSGGSHTHTISTQADHTHTAGTLAGPSHSHSTPDHAHTISGSTANESAHTHTFSGTTDLGDNHSATDIENVDDNNDGVQTGVLHGNWTGHDHTFSGTTDAGSAHLHAAGTLAADSGGSGTSGSGGTGAVTGSTASGGSHNHTGVTGGASGSTGTGNPPFMSLNYIIKD